MREVEQRGDGDHPDEEEEGGDQTSRSGENSFQVQMEDNISELSRKDMDTDVETDHIYNTSQAEAELESSKETDEEGFTPVTRRKSRGKGKGKGNNTRHGDGQSGVHRYSTRRSK